MKYIIIFGILFIVSAICYFLFTLYKRDTYHVSDVNMTITSSAVGFVLDQETKDSLTNSRELSFKSSKIFAKSISGDYLKKGYKIWLITQHPGLLDRPSETIGVANNQLTKLSSLELSIKFYNEAVIPPKNEDSVTSIALDILKATYHRDEFEYGENSIRARGYRVINSVNDIVSANKSADLITEPKTTMSRETEGRLFKTIIWYWGAHNCELHRFEMMSKKVIVSGFSLLSGVEQFKIIEFKDEMTDNLGKCNPLFYE